MDTVDFIMLIIPSFVCLATTIITLIVVCQIDDYVGEIKKKICGD